MEKMMEYAYSLNEEDWTDHESIIDRINDEFDAGTKVTVHKGEQHPLKHSDSFNVDRLIEDIQECAYDEAGEVKYPM